ncbi:unnamed protein product [Linum trigynum]|uniref:Uncharacterized protein n=1 Tax=Linum trigynum TaxID=586398 RepID=A0AAV2CS65_9ROSI
MGQLKVDFGLTMAKPKIDFGLTEGQPNVDLGLTEGQPNGGFGRRREGRLTFLARTDGDCWRWGRRRRLLATALRAKTATAGDDAAGRRRVGCGDAAD